MSKKRINSKQKGNRGEREWAKICREHGYDCKRSQQYAGGTEESADVVGLPYIHQEVKYGYDMTVEEIRGFLSQAISDAVSARDWENNELLLPIVAHKKTYGKWFVTMESIDFAYMVNIAFSNMSYGDITYLIRPEHELYYVTTPVEDWFSIYKEFESFMAISEKEGA